MEEIDLWDICDQICMNLFEKMPLVWKEILDWAERNDKFVKMASLCADSLLGVA